MIFFATIVSRETQPKDIIAKIQLKQFYMLFAQAIKPGGKALSVIYSTYLGLGLYDVCIQSLIM